MVLTPVMLSRAALLRARLAVLAHQKGGHDQDDHAGIDADDVFPDPFEILASKRAGGHHLALFVDTDNSLNGGENARYVAVRMHEGGSKAWDDETISESLIVGIDDVDTLSDAMSRAADDTNAYVDPLGKITKEDHDNRPDDDEGPIQISRTLLGKFTIYGYYDRYGDRAREGGRFVTVGAVATDPDPTWDENVTIIDTRKVKFVVDGMKEMRDAAPTDRLSADWREQGRDEKGRWTKGYRSVTDGVEDLAEMVDEIERLGIKGEKMYGGDSSVTELFRLPDGRKIVRKQTPAWGEPKQPKIDADAEQLGGMVARALGANTARVYRTDKSTIFMEFIDGDDLFEFDEIEFQSNASKRLGLLDVLISNPDRNKGNMIMTSNGLVGIDHGGAFFGAQMEAHAKSQKFRDLYAEPLGATGPLDDMRPNSLFVRDTGEFEDDIGRPTAREWIDNPMSPPDVDETRRRLESLRAEFKFFGREDWLNYSLRTLDEIAKYAVAGESIYND